MVLPEDLANNMKKFQAHNDLPVFLKGGPIDKALFGITTALAVVGLLSIVHMGYDLGFKKKQG